MRCVIGFVHVAEIKTTGYRSAYAPSVSTYALRWPQVMSNFTIHPGWVSQKAKLILVGFAVVPLTAMLPFRWMQGLVAPESALRDEASGKIAVNKVSLASIAFALVVVAASSHARQSSDGDALPALRARTLEKSRVVQLRGYSASGTHQCGPGRSCVVTASGFSNCNDASAVLQTRDCCPTTPAGGRSSGFVLNYCIPDRPL